VGDRCCQVNFIQPSGARPPYNLKGRGEYSTIKDRAWHVLSNTNHLSLMSGYQSEHEQVLSVVNAVMKAYIEGRDKPVLFVMHYATLVVDENEKESLHVPFQSMRHGIKFDLIPKIHGGKCNMAIEQEEFPIKFDGEKIFFNIEKPTQEELDRYDCYELTSEAEMSKIWEQRVRRKSKKTTHEGIPLAKWRRRLVLAPADIVEKTLETTMQYYMTVDCENRTNMRQHYQSRFRGLKLPRLKEGVATDTFFPSEKTSMGHACSQFFVGTDTDRWYVQPLKKESHNSTALQDFSRNVGLPLFVKSDCTQSEIGEKWTEHCRDHCIGMLTSEPGHPWQNPAEKRIGTLGNMVIANMRETGMPMQYHNWMQLWCVDVHNVLWSKNLGYQNPLCYSTGYTTDISKFRFYPWEPIWYYIPSAKAPHDNLKKARWLGFAHTAGDKMTYYIRTEKEPGEG